MSLLNRAQQIIGAKEFTHAATFDANVVFKKDVVFNQHITGYAPVAGEPSLGTPHECSYASRYAAWQVDTAANTAGVWSAPVTAPCPSGTKMVYCLVLTYAAGGAGVGLVCLERASGITLDDVSATGGNNWLKYRCVRNDDATQRVGVMTWIPLDANYQFRWACYQGSTRVSIGYPVDYDI
jgi:hypothetical protein